MRRQATHARRSPSCWLVADCGGRSTLDELDRSGCELSKTRIGHVKLFDVRRSAPSEFVVFFDGEVAGLSLPGPRGKQGEFEVDALQCVDENKVGRLDVDP